MQNKSLDDFFSLDNIKRLLIDKGFNKILSSLIIKILNKNNKIRELVVSEIINPNSKLVNENKEMDNRKRIAFDNIGVGDIILAGTPNYKREDLSHYYRPFLVLKKEEDKLYAFYSTSNSNYKDNPKYHEIYNANDNKKYSYIDCSNIHIITFDLFVKLISKYKVNGISEKDMLNILDNAVVYGDFSEYIDYKTLDCEVQKGSIIKSGTNYYLITKIYQNDNYYLGNLLVRRKDEKNYISLFGRQYVLQKDKYKVPFDVIDSVITKIDLNNYDKYYKSDNSDSGKIKKVKEEGPKYLFGDVLNLKDSKEKIIYLARNNDSIYYIDFNQLDLFISIKNINKKKVNGIYRKLTDDEFNKLINKLNKPMIDDRIYYVPTRVKDQIEIHCKKR